MVRYILAGLVPAILFALAGCKTTEVAERPPNPGSHLTQWMYYDLLAGRVTIQFGYYPAEYKNWFVDDAIYHTRDGDSLICEGEKRRYESRIVDGYFFTRSGEDWMAAVTLIGNDDDTLPVFYDPQTGRFHVETWNRSRGDWMLYSDGWVQESWPRAMADACPDLPIPDDLPINELQTHPSIWKMLEQDPTAPFRMPDEGPTRLGIAQTFYDQPFSWCFEAPGRPVLPEHCKGHESTEPSAALPGSPEEDREDIEALAEALREGDGMVLEDRLGAVTVRLEVAERLAGGLVARVAGDHPDRGPAALAHDGGGRCAVARHPLRHADPPGMTAEAVSQSGGLRRGGDPACDLAV